MVEYPFKSCGCELCELIHKLHNEGFMRDGGWCDPRRYYFENEEEFIKRVPDGILRWPKEHIDITTKEKGVFRWKKIV